VSEDLMNLKNYVDYSIGNMRTFISKYSKLVTYKEFIGELNIHLSNLEELAIEIGNINTFTVSIYKITEIGSLLKKYYNIYENAEFGKSLLYSFEFEGYLNNMKGAHINLVEGKINKAMFSKEEQQSSLAKEEKKEEKDEKKEEKDDKEDKGDKDDISTIFKDQYYPTHNSGVTNDCQIKKNIIITGPNASGKTTYLKTTMLNIIFTQQIGFGFYSSAKLTPYTHIHSYLNIPDTSGRDSLFQAESRRCKEIIDIINENKDGRHFAIFDELYSGTNPVEASKSAYAFLLYLSGKTNVDFILTTHYRTLCKKLRKHPKIKCLKMNARELANGQIEYTYQICSGISKIQGAVKVLKEMDYPREIIETIENM
jgi:energy-coupling factor transporter ATP-binding protein EcfA2